MVTNVIHPTRTVGEVTAVRVLQRMLLCGFPVHVRVIPEMHWMQLFVQQLRFGISCFGAQQAHSLVKLTELDRLAYSV